MHSSLLSWHDSYLRKLKDLSQNSQNRRSGEQANCLFETCKNFVMPDGRYIDATTAVMAMATMCSYPPSKHALPHCKCVLRCCYNCPRIDLPVQESDTRFSNASPYHLIAQCIVHGRRSLDEKKICCLCFQDPSNVIPAKLYTRKELVLMETSIADFHKNFYIPAIKKARITPYTRTHSR